MMNFGARMEEILRRSEEMKKVQQRRKRMLLTAIPMALCCVLCLGIFPFLEGGRSGETGSPNGGMAAPEHSERHDCISVVIPAQTVSPEMSDGNNFSSNITGIQIEGNNLDRTSNDLVLIDTLRGMLAHLTAVDPAPSSSGTPVGGTGSEPGDGKTTFGNGQPKEGYILSFSGDQGMICQYHLYKNRLTDLSTGVTKILAEHDATALYRLLDVPME